MGALSLSNAQIASLVSTANANSASRGNGPATVAQALQLAKEWQQRVKKTLQDNVGKHSYKPGGGVGHTGYFQANVANLGPIQQTTGNATVLGQTVPYVGAVSTSVSYNAYSRESWIGQGSVDIPTLFEAGWTTRANVPWRNTPYAGIRNAAPIMSMTVAELAPQAAGCGVKISLG